MICSFGGIGEILLLQHSEILSFAPSQASIPKLLLCSATGYQGECIGQDSGEASCAQGSQCEQVLILDKDYIPMKIDCFLLTKNQAALS